MLSDFATFGTAALDKIFHAAFELCSASGMIPDTFFISDYGFASAAFLNYTMMIEAESDYLMQHDRSPAAKWRRCVIK